MSEASSLATTIPRHAGQLVPLFCFRVCLIVCACSTTTTISIYCCDYGSAFRGPPTLTFFVFDVQASPCTIFFFIFFVVALLWLLLPIAVFHFEPLTGMDATRRSVFLRRGSWEVFV